MKISEQYDNSQLLYTQMLCTIHGIPQRAAPVLTELVKYADKTGHVKITMDTKRTIAAKLEITIDALTKTIKLADEKLLEVYGSLRFQLKPQLADCHHVSICFINDRIEIHVNETAVSEGQQKTSANKKAKLGLAKEKHTV